MNIENKEFIDDENLDSAEMVQFMQASKKASSTACPSPQLWREKMTEGETNICLTVSKNLSGSYQSADIATRGILEESAATKAYVVDSCATGPALVLAVRKLVEGIENGEEMDTIIKNTEEYISKINTVFALSCFDNLVKAGRVSKIAGVLAANTPTPLEHVAIKDKFGQSGTPAELMKAYGLDAENIVKACKKAISRK